MNKGQITVEYSSAVTWNDFCQELGEVQPDVVHISVHAQSTSLYFEHEGTHKQDQRPIDQVVATLHGTLYMPTVVLFMSCDGHELGAVCKDRFPATVTSLAGLNDADALRFIETFYSSLFAGGNVHWSFNNAQWDTQTDQQALELYAHDAAQTYLVGQGPPAPGGEREQIPEQQILSRLHTSPQGA